MKEREKNKIIKHFYDFENKWIYNYILATEFKDKFNNLFLINNLIN